MIERILIRILRSLSGYFNSKFHENFDMTSSAAELYDNGINLRASGFVIPTSDSAVGVYIVKYIPSIKENKYGRYN